MQIALIYPNRILTCHNQIVKPSLSSLRPDVEFVRPGRACVSSHAGDTLLVVRSLGPCNRNCYVVLILVFLITFIRQWDNISFSYFVEIHSFGSYFIHDYIAQHRFSCLVTREQVCERRIKFYGSWRQYWKTTFAAMDCKHLDETVRIGWVIRRFDTPLPSLHPCCYPKYHIQCLTSKPLILWVSHNVC